MVMMFVGVVVLMFVGVVVLMFDGFLVLFLLYNIYGAGVFRSKIVFRSLSCKPTSADAAAASAVADAAATCRRF